MTPLCGNLNELCLAGGRWDSLTIANQPFNMKRHRFMNESRHFWTRLSHRNAPRQVGNVGTVAGWTFFNNDKILH